MQATSPERKERAVSRRPIDPSRAHVLQAPLGLRTGRKSRKPTGGFWTYVPPPPDPR